MSIWSLWPITNTYSVVPISREDFAVFEQLDGRVMGSNWPVPRVSYGYDREQAMPAKVDFPWRNADVVVMRAGIPRAIRQEFLRWGELLPLACAEEELLLFNCTTVVDALDEARSEIVRFRSGRVMVIDRYAFRAERLTEAGIFRIPQWGYGGELYVNDAFRDLILGSGLTGLAFKQLWHPVEAPDGYELRTWRNPSSGERGGGW